MTTLVPKYDNGGTGAVNRPFNEKLQESVSVLDFGADPTGVADSTTAFNNAIAAAGAYGSNGVINIPLGTFNLTQITLLGSTVITLKGMGGGSLANPDKGSVLNFTNTTGDSLSVDSSPSYAAAKFVFEDLCIKANTTGYALAFNGNVSPAYPISQVFLNRITVSNYGGTTFNTGNGIRFSLAYYVYATGINVEKLGSFLFGDGGIGISIDMGAATSYLGGEFNFYDCNFQNFNVGFQAGNQQLAPTANENYPNVNLIGCNPQNCSQGIVLAYGIKSALIQGCYVEGCLNRGIFVANEAKNVTIQSCFFNNSTATDGDIGFGSNFAGISYTQFYNCIVKDCIFISVKNFGIKTYGSGTYNLIQNTLSVENCNFTLSTAGAIAIFSNVSSANGFQWFFTAKNCNTYGFATGNGFNGRFTSLQNCNEATSTGVPIIGYANSILALATYAADYQLLANDPETVTIINTRAGARLYAAVPATSKGRKQFIVNDATSTQSIALYNGVGTTLATSLAAGGKAIIWNDGTTDYVSVI